MQRFIYALIDPRDHVVRYVGKTTRGMDRLFNHRCDKTRTPRGHWIRKLNRLGLRFNFTILDLSPDDLNEAERFWIAVYRISSGRKLLNLTDGGDGGNRPWLGRKRPPFSAECRAKMSASRTGKRHSQEARENMRAAAYRRQEVSAHV